MMAKNTSVRPVLILLLGTVFLASCANRGHHHGSSGHDTGHASSSHDDGHDGGHGSGHHVDEHGNVDDEVYYREH